MSHGTAIKRSSSDVHGEGVKRAKTEEQPPSAVLHVRNIPVDCTEQDLITLAQPFGRVANVLLLKNKQQGFVQMQDVTFAMALVAFYSSVPATIRSKPVYFQYSSRDTISGQAASIPEGSDNKVLLVTVLNIVYPITIDVDLLQQIFTKYGTVLKIITFTKGGQFQALVQYADQNAATFGKQNLDGQNIYSGCCTLRIQYSSLKNLNVKFNNDKSRDFTNPSLPTSSGASSALPSAAPPHSLYPGQPSFIPGAPSGAAAFPMYSPAAVGGLPNVVKMGGAPSVLIASGFEPTRITPDIIFTLFGVYGDVVRVKILFTKKDTALIQFSTPDQAETAMMHLNNCQLHGKVLQINFSKHWSISMPRAGSEEDSVELTKDYMGSTLHRYKVMGSKNFSHIHAPSGTLHVSNLHASATDESLSALFGQFGTVAVVRFFAKDRRMALVQMSSLAEGVEALINLHNHRFLDQFIRVSFSSGNISRTEQSAQQDGN